MDINAIFLDIQLEIRANLRLASEGIHFNTDKTNFDIETVAETLSHEFVPVFEPEETAMYNKMKRLVNKCKEIEYSLTITLDMCETAQASTEAMTTTVDLFEELHDKTAYFESSIDKRWVEVFTFLIDKLEVLVDSNNSRAVDKIFGIIHSAIDQGLLTDLSLLTRANEAANTWMEKSAVQAMEKLSISKPNPAGKKIMEKMDLKPVIVDTPASHRKLQRWSVPKPMDMNQIPRLASPLKAERLEFPEKAGLKTPVANKRSSLVYERTPIATHTPIASHTPAASHTPSTSRRSSYMSSHSPARSTSSPVQPSRIPVPVKRVSMPPPMLVVPKQRRSSMSHSQTPQTPQHKVTTRRSVSTPGPSRLRAPTPLHSLIRN